MDVLTLRKATSYIKKVIAKAERERDRKGYRENLGYDSHNQVRDYLNTLELSYIEHSALMKQFNALCDRI